MPYTEITYSNGQRGDINTDTDPTLAVTNTPIQSYQPSAALLAFFADPLAATEPFHPTPYWNRIAQAFRILVQQRTMTKLVTNRAFIEARYAPERSALPALTDTLRLTQAQERLDQLAQAMGKVVRRAFDADPYGVDFCPKAEDLLTSLHRNVFATIVRDAREMNITASTFSFDEQVGRYAREATLDLVGEMMYMASRHTELGILAALHECRWGTLSNNRITSSTTLNQLRNTVRELMRLDDEAEVSEWLRDNYDMVECEDCGEWEHSGFTSRVYSDEYVCRSCIESHYTWSNYHDQHVHDDYAVRVIGRDGDGDYIHEDERDNGDFEWDDDEECYVHTSYRPPSRTLRRYHTAKSNEAYRLIHSDWADRNNRFFGIELEVECRKGYPGEYADKLNDALNDGRLGERCFFEEDGSLSNGFEIITQPMGLDSHYQFWEWLTDKELTRDLRSHDTSTCGLHIHINRNNIKDLQINKMCVFIHSPDNSNLIRAIARRYGVGYASMHEKKLGTAHQASRGDPRYEAVNLTNRRTIEMRIFKGTLKHGSMLAALEFTNALVHFTAPASPAGFVLNTSRFMDYINSNDMKADTRNLRKYLTDVGFTS